MSFLGQITLTTAGSNTGPDFDLYSNADSYTTPFAAGISKATLLSGYISSAIPDGTTIIRVKSTNSPFCTPDYVDISLVAPSPTPTTTTINPTPTTTPEIITLTITNSSDSTVTINGLVITRNPDTDNIDYTAIPDNNAPVSPGQTVDLSMPGNIDDIYSLYLNLVGTLPGTYVHFTGDFPACDELINLVNGELYGNIHASETGTISVTINRVSCV